MKYQAKWKDTVLAEADESQVLMIEGNVYFHPDTVKMEYFKPTEMKTHCPWKGESSYYTITVDGEENPDAAWHYSEPKSGAAEKVDQQNSGNSFGGDFTDFVAFWNGISVEEVE